MPKVIWKTNIYTYTIKAHFTILKYLLLYSSGYISVTYNKLKHKLTIRVDRSKISIYGKPALSRILLQLYIFRYIADIEGCYTYYKELSKVEGEYIE
jgi:dipeptidyl-peptidase-3